jgi:hypothetical protein
MPATAPDPTMVGWHEWKTQFERKNLMPQLKKFMAANLIRDFLAIDMTTRNQTLRFR